MGMMPIAIHALHTPIHPLHTLILFMINPESSDAVVEVAGVNKRAPTLFINAPVWMLGLPMMIWVFVLLEA